MVSRRKRIAFFGSLALCALLLFCLLAIKSSILLLSQVHPAPALPPLPPGAEEDQQLLARGRHLVRDLMACGQCHGSDLRGGISLQAPDVGELASADLVGVRRSVDDLQRTLRYGLDSQQRALWLMPSAATSQLCDADRQATVAYLRQLARAGEAPAAAQAGRASHKSLTTGGRVRLLLRQLQLHEAESAGRAPPPLLAIAPSATPFYGNYLFTVARCSQCHQGGRSAGEPPSALQMQLYGWRAGALPPSLAAAGHDAFAAALSKVSDRPGLSWHPGGALTPLEQEALRLAVSAN